VERRSIGVDGYAKGWVAVALSDGSFERAWSSSSLPALLSDVAPGTPVGVDIPLGGLESGWRTADREARRLLGARRGSVFSVPPRPVWQLDSHEAASALCRELTGSGFSIQAWGLMRKMLDAERYRDVGLCELYEVHPELVFRRLAGQALEYGKKTWNGQCRRRALLAGEGVVLPGDLGTAGAVPVDDVLDAAAVAWCSYRIVTGTATSVPDPPDQYDHAGRPIVIWY
jgi:predicted RNase H-like nuclease